VRCKVLRAIAASSRTAPYTAEGVGAKRFKAIEPVTGEGFEPLLRHTQSVTAARAQ
jgi:hypothetical protein